MRGLKLSYEMILEELHPHSLLLPPRIRGFSPRTRSRVCNLGKLPNNPMNPCRRGNGSARSVARAGGQCWRFLQLPPGRERSSAGGVDLLARRLEAAAAGPQRPGGRATTTAACPLRPACQRPLSSTAGLCGLVRDSTSRLGIGPCRRMEVEKRTSGLECGGSVHGESNTPQGGPHRTAQNRTSRAGRRDAAAAHLTRRQVYEVGPGGCRLWKLELGGWR